MNEKQFKLILSSVSSALRKLEGFGELITNDLIEKTVDKELDELENHLKNFEFEDTDVSRLKFILRNLFDISIDDESIVLGNPAAIRWFDNKKSKISWNHWNAYKEMLLSQQRAPEVIDKNEEIIDQILDLSMDPTDKRYWKR